MENTGSYLNIEVINNLPAGRWRTFLLCTSLDDQEILDVLKKGAPELLTNNPVYPISLQALFVASGYNNLPTRRKLFESGGSLVSGAENLVYR